MHTIQGIAKTADKTDQLSIESTTRKRADLFYFCFFLGVLGAHRFYAGKIGTGFIYLFTGGLLGAGVIADLILILAGGFKDKNGVLVKEW